MLTGIDVYHGTGTVDWNRVKQAGHSFGICKATEGLHLVDTYLRQNLDGIHNAGLVRMAYHFCRFALDAEQQAQHFVNSVRDNGYNLASEMRLIADMEDRPGVESLGDNPAAMDTWIEKFLHVIESESGKQAIIYGDRDFLEHNVRGRGGHALWIAAYNNNPAPPVPAGWTDWKFWQYSENGNCPGVTENVVDLNRFNGDMTALLALRA